MGDAARKRRERANAAWMVPAMPTMLPGGTRITHYGAGGLILPCGRRSGGGFTLSNGAYVALKLGGLRLPTGTGDLLEEAVGNASQP